MVIAFTDAIETLLNVSEISYSLKTLKETPESSSRT